MKQSSDGDEGHRMKVLIIGGGLGGMSLAMELSRKNKDMDVTVIKKEKLGSYSPCGMPFVLEGEVERMEDIILNTPNFYAQKGINLKMGFEATEIDLENNKVHLNSGEILSYDKLVIATGRKTFIPPIDGVDLDGVYKLTDYEDGKILFEAMKNVKKAVVIGGGIIGLETAVAFAKRNIKTTIIEMLPYVLPQILDEDMATIVRKRLNDMGIEVFTSTKVLSIKGERKVESVVTEGKEFKADLVLIATGVRPNADIAEKVGITIGKTGGVVVNSSLNVQKDGKHLKNVFAFGDCVEVNNKITNLHQVSALGSSAVLQARIIAENICGGDVNIEGFLSPTIMRIGGLQVGSVGLTSHTATQSGLDFIISKSSGPTRSSYCPRKKEIQIKLFMHDDKLIGAQMISEEDVKERVNALTLAIKNEMTIQDLLYTERCFTPPLSMLTDPLIRALENF
jgi:NADH oxidase (H2O2-forming)